MSNITETPMNFSKSIFLLFFVLSFSFLFAQKDTIYVDENFNKLSKSIFYQKLKSRVYDGYRHSTDTLVLERLNLKFIFGKLSPNIKTQLFKLLNLRHKIDTTKTLIIHYSDTLKSIKQFPEKNYIIYRDSLYNIIKKTTGTRVIMNPSEFKKVKKHEHFYSYKSFIKEYEKCMRDHKKYRDIAQVLHFYNYNNGHPNKVGKLQWFKDYGSVIKNMFLVGNDHFNLIILHPNGDFYLQEQFYESLHPYKNLINKMDWKEYENKFLEAIKQ